MIKKYTQFITEADDFNEKDSTDFTNILSDIKEMINKTIENSGGEFNTFVSNIITEPADYKVDGFINDSDIYEFYLKYRNDVDDVLNSINYFSIRPNKTNSFGLYDYLVNGTERAFIEFIKMIKKGK